MVQLTGTTSHECRLVSTMKNNSQVCYRVPIYPKSAYVVFFFSHSGTEELSAYPMSNIYTDLHDIPALAQHFGEELSQDEPDKKIYETACVLPIRFLSLYPLKEEYWQNPSIHFDAADRVRQFMQVLSYPLFYKLIVTPKAQESSGDLLASIPYPIAAPESDIEKFMILTDFPVDQTAKYAAIYTFGLPLQFNWETGSITKPATVHTPKSHSNFN